MPAIITHDFFGRDVYDRLFSLIGGSRDEADAFLLGNQGPDPLFYTVASPRLRAHNRLGSIMHATKPTELICALRESIDALDDSERSVGRAYALGFLCHYALDSTMHPFIYFHEHRLCDAGEPGLSREDGSEVHAVIESELDELVLYRKREETIAAFNPSTEILRASKGVLRTVSKMYAYIAFSVYDQFIPVNMFQTAVQDFRMIQRAFYSPAGAKRALLGRLERAVRPHSFYQSMSHRAVELEESPFDNRERAPWNNPFTGDVRTAGFWDLYDEAQRKAHGFIAAFDADAFGMDEARAITRDLNFSGEPVQATLVAVEDVESASAASDAPAACSAPATCGADARAADADEGE